MAGEFPKANLSVATTKELLEELQARGEGLVHTDIFTLLVFAGYLLDTLPEDVLDYRGVYK
jgi:hypothetical protein